MTTKMGRYESQFTGKPSKFSLFIVVTMCVAVSSNQRRPRLVSRPSDPLIGKSNGNASFDWAFELLPTETWNESIYELSFGLWSSPGYLKKKLMAIDRRGQVLVRSKYENKISCHFNISRMQVEFTLRSLSKEDAKHYGLHVEFVLARAPLVDTVILRVEDPPKTSSPALQENVTVKNGDQNVPRTSSSSKSSNSPALWISLAVISVSVLLTLTVLILRHRRRLKRDIHYERQIDAGTPNKYSIPAAI